MSFSEWSEPDTFCILLGLDTALGAHAGMVGLGCWLVSWHGLAVVVLMGFFCK